MKLVDLKSKKIVESWYRYNDGTRTLLESVVVPEVARALNDWQKAKVQNCVLIGGLALSYHGHVRATMDCDFLFIGNNSVPTEVEGFKKTRGHAFRHNETHVEIEVLDPAFLDMSVDLVQKIIDTAAETDGMRVASKEGLIASKLKRFSRQDQADIEHLIKAGGKLDDSWPLTDEFRKRYEQIASSI